MSCPLRLLAWTEKPCERHPCCCGEESLNKDETGEDIVREKSVLFFVIERNQEAIEKCSFDADKAMGDPYLYIELARLKVATSSASNIDGPGSLITQKKLIAEAPQSVSSNGVIGMGYHLHLQMGKHASLGRPADENSTTSQALEARPRRASRGT